MLEGPPLLQPQTPLPIFLSSLSARVEDQEEEGRPHALRWGTPQTSGPMLGIDMIGAPVSRGDVQLYEIS